MTDRVLMLRAIGLGDFLTGVPSYRAIRAGWPDAEIWLAAPEPLRPLIAATGAIDALLPTPRLGELPALDWRPSVAVNLHGVGPESENDLIRTAPHRLITYVRSDPDDHDRLLWRSDQHEIVRWCRLLQHAGLPADPDDLLLPAPELAPVVEDAVVIHPGAASGSRRWPVERFAEVGAELVRRGCRVVVTGTEPERPAAHWLADRLGLGEDRRLAGKLALDELAALVAAARLVICGDTGVGHLATAFGTRSVLLFGPTPPAYWGPRHGPHRVLYAATSETGDLGDPHADEVDPRLLRIDVPAVLTAAVSWLDAPRPAQPPHRPGTHPSQSDPTGSA